MVEIKKLSKLLVELNETKNRKLSENIKTLEVIVKNTTDLLVTGKDSQLLDFIENVVNVFTKCSNAKSSKAISKIISELSKKKFNWNLKSAINLCLKTIKNCRKNNKRNLSYRIKQQLCELYYKAKRFDVALKVMNRLLKEIKTLDNKLLLVELHMLESCIQHSLRNIPKAKAALTACRASSNSLYINPNLLASIDLQTGIIATEENDFKIAYSYFYEAFEGCRIQKDKRRAKKALIYMMLCKIMNKKYKELNLLVSNKVILQFNGHAVQRMYLISKVCENHSLKELEKILDEINFEDKLLKNKITQIRDELEEENIIKLLKPYSKVQIVHISNLINLPLEYIIRKLSQMILDKKIDAILNQETGSLIKNVSIVKSTSFKYALDLLEKLENIIELFLINSYIK